MHIYTCYSGMLVVPEWKSASVTGLFCVIWYNFIFRIYSLSVCTQRVSGFDNDNV